MKRLFPARLGGFLAALTLIWPVGLRAQVNITAEDMFNQPGQYFRAYANSANNDTINVSGLLGAPGGPQLWDFTSGPSDVIYRFDYHQAADTPYGADFVAGGAEIAEQKSDEAGIIDEAWLYFTQDPGQGRITYGFYDPAFAAGIGGSELQEVFDPPLHDFPATIRYGDAWNSFTSFTNLLSFGDSGDFVFSLVVRIVYSSTATVDAYGVINSPGLGFDDGLRVNELVTYDISYDDGSGSFEHLETDYVRNYYWLRPGRGIVAQVTSQQSSGAPPPDNFFTASAVMRMFETNHPDHGSTTGGGIQGLKITLGKSGALLQWTTLSSVSKYQVEYTFDLGAGWEPAGEPTTANYFIDPAAVIPGASRRFYRVVGMP